MTTDTPTAEQIRNHVASTCAVCLTDEACDAIELFVRRARAAMYALPHQKKGDLGPILELAKAAKKLRARWESLSEKQREQVEVWYGSPFQNEPPAISVDLPLVTERIQSSADALQLAKQKGTDIVCRLIRLIDFVLLWVLVEDGKRPHTTHEDRRVIVAEILKLAGPQFEKSQATVKDHLLKKNEPFADTPRTARVTGTPLASVALQHEAPLPGTDVDAVRFATAVILAARRNRSE